MPKETFSTIKDIFSAGTWNGHDFTIADLDDMVNNFERLTKEQQNFKVPFKVDLFKNAKPKDQRHGGQPAVGWITEIKRVGQKLYAHIENIPKTVKELIESKAYRQVSAELRFNMKYGEERLHRVLTGVALLGIELPGVSNLDEFVKLYTVGKEEEGETVNIFTVEEIPQQEGNSMSLTPEEIKKLQEENEQLKTFAAKAEQEKKDAEVKAEAEAQKARELADGQRKAEIKVFVEKASAEGKVLPKHVVVVTAIAENLDAGKMVKFTAADGKEKEESVLSRFFSFIGELPKLVEFNEKTEDSTTNNGDIFATFAEKPAEEAGDVKGQKLHHATLHYMSKDEKLDYDHAYDIAVKNHPELI
jgi:hypothetical protein